MRILWQDQRGAALVYVTVMIGVLVGFAALAVDVGRITTTHTQARSAAEAGDVRAFAIPAIRPLWLRSDRMRSVVAVAWVKGMA